MKKEDKIKAEITITSKRSNSKSFDIKIKFINPSKVKKISGHKFVSLHGKNPYSNDLSLILDFYNLTTFKGNIFTECGLLLEEDVIKTQTDNYKMFSYEEYKGDMFHYDDFGGLIDYYDNNTNRLGEVKTYYSPTKLTKWIYNIRLGKSEPITTLPEQWSYQAQFYLNLYNKTLIPEGQPLIEYIDIIACYVPDTKNPKVEEKNIKVFPIKYNPDFNTEIFNSKGLKKELLKQDDKGYLNTSILKNKMNLQYIEELEQDERFEIIWNI